MSEVLKVVIPGDVITKEKTYTLNIKLAKDKNFFVTGTVYDSEKVPLNNAAVAVYQINQSDSQKKTLIGVTFSYLDGTYGISLPYGYSYILMIYS